MTPTVPTPITPTPPQTSSPTPTTTNTTTPYSPKIRPPPPHHTKTKPPTTTTHRPRPPHPTHIHRDKRNTKTPVARKNAQKMADFRHFFNNKPPITPTFAPCFWLFLRDYLQFLKISSNVHRPVLRYFLYLFPVHFHYSGRPLSVLFLNNN